jgi:endonuclease G
MKKLIYLLILLPILSYSQDDKYLPTTSQGIIIKHNNYIVSYVEKFEGSEWCAYEFIPEETIDNVDRKSGDFMKDPLIETGSAQHSDYTNTGYDRGHLAPAADMKFSADAMFESFYMSNVLPQAPKLNRNTWKYLEADIRNYVIRTRDTLYIFTGGIILNITNPTSINYIGSDSVAIPQFFYKIVYNQSKNNILAIAIPNYNDVSADYFGYVSTVDEIEKLTGIDFFPELETLKQEIMESRRETINWLKQ